MNLLIGVVILIFSAVSAARQGDTSLIEIIAMFAAFLIIFPLFLFIILHLEIVAVTIIILSVIAAISK